MTRVLACYTERANRDRSAPCLNPASFKCQGPCASNAGSGSADKESLYVQQSPQSSLMRFFHMPFLFQTNFRGGGALFASGASNEASIFDAWQCWAGKRPSSHAPNPGKRFYSESRQVGLCALKPCREATEDEGGISSEGSARSRDQSESSSSGVDCRSCQKVPRDQCSSD